MASSSQQKNAVLQVTITNNPSLGGHVSGWMSRLKHECFNETKTEKYRIVYIETTATAGGINVTLDFSINPLHAVMFPGLSSRHVSTSLREYLFFGFHSKFNRSVHPDFVILAARDIPATGQIRPETGGGGE